MWIIRLNKLTTKEYNLIARTFKKIGFHPRGTPSIIFFKALLFALLQKKSWRAIAREFHISHIALYNFYNKHGKCKEIQEIFHTFADRKIIVFVADNKSFNTEQLDNSDEFLHLTFSELKSIL